MTDPSKSAGERIVNFCIGALVCAICLTLASDLLKALWPFFVILALVVLVIGVAYYRFRRW